MRVLYILLIPLARSRDRRRLDGDSARGQEPTSGGTGPVSNTNQAADIITTIERGDRLVEEVKQLLAMYESREGTVDPTRRV